MYFPGKCEQNPRKHQRVELVNDVSRIRKLLADPSYISHKTFFGDEDEGGSLAAVHRKTAVLKMNKPLYAGFAILELSKLLMFEHYYDFLKPKYGDKIRLCFTDTDSFLYHVETEDAYKDMIEDQHLYDTSVYRDSLDDVNVPESLRTVLRQLCNSKNKKVPGKFSDESTGHPIKAFVGLRSKMYSIKIPSAEDKRKAKGVPEHKTKFVKFELFLETLKTGDVSTTKYRSIDSKCMQLVEKDHCKLMMSAFDDKRLVLINICTIRQCTVIHLMT